MRILKIKANGLKLFSDNLEIDFTTIQRVRNDRSEMLYKISPQIYQNNALAFVGINASGKTTTLKVISFIIQLLNNEPINNIKNKEILNGILEKDKIEFDFQMSNRLIFTEEQREIYTIKGGIPDLDGDYTVFGEIIEGMEVVDRIAALKTDKNNRPYKDVKMELIVVK